MFPFDVDPRWYENYWLSERPQPKRRSVSRNLARVAVVVALVAGGGAVLSRYHAGHDVGGYQSWEQE